jgi:signal transduction histidine kinase
MNGNRLTLFKRIVADNEILGTVYLSAEYDLLGRLGDYAAILTVVLVASLAAALLMSSRLHKSVTGPIADITSVARQVIEKRDFTPRASTRSEDEVGVLATAFNSMLAEIDSRTKTLEESNERLLTAEQSLRTLNAELEERVALRTSQLEAANKDLEGFSYSVSHDLRAPIRAIGGFCTLLTKDHGPQLDAEAQRKLGVIKGEAERMGALIDDLLAFSRLGRKALQPAEIDMRDLASTAYKRLLNGHTDHSIDFRIGTLPHATADRSLLEQVWVNLLSNAIKFSGKKDAPVVEVGAIAEEREYVYFVRDNGAGFDPRYAAKLFGVFQRLHDAVEFPGTGVGLALVQRIVVRHGGRVWADSKPGEGATFHYTLPKESGHAAV